MLIRLLKYTWASPNTIIGLFFLLIAWLSKGRIKKVSGAIELSGKVIEKFLNLFKVGAMTLGHVILGHVILGQDESVLDQCRAHEHIHIKQCERWGLFFIPAYLISSLYAFLRGKHYYYDNHFEVEAFSKTK